MLELIVDNVAHFGCPLLHVSSDDISIDYLINLIFACCSTSYFKVEKEENNCVGAFVKLTQNLHQPPLLSRQHIPLTQVQNADKLDVINTNVGLLIYGVHLSGSDTGELCAV